MTSSFGSLIWLTGYSSSGKTTIGKSLAEKLKNYSDKIIYLDGDNLREILGGTHGYTKTERINLGIIYFKLCKNLIDQGFIVVISSIALFQEILNWVRLNIPKSHIVFIECPLNDRKKRDALTKKIRLNDISIDAQYDLLTDYDLIVSNSNSQSIQTVTEQIFKQILALIGSNKDYGRSSHWSEFYKNNSFNNSSSFAKFVTDREVTPVNIIDIGCGDGRDSAWFLVNNHNVFSIDRSLEAIKKCQSRNLQGNIFFKNIEANELDESFREIFDVAYCRFVLHAMPLDEELSTLKAAFKILKKGGRFYIECRSINDPYFDFGINLSSTEKIFGHYRRFIILDELLYRLKNNGFFITYQIESNNLSVHGDDNPVLIRVIGIKQ